MKLVEVDPKYESRYSLNIAWLLRFECSKCGSGCCSTDSFCRDCGHKFVRPKFFDPRSNNHEWMYDAMKFYFEYMKENGK